MSDECFYQKFSLIATLKPQPAKPMCYGPYNDSPPAPVRKRIGLCCDFCYEIFEKYTRNKGVRKQSFHTDRAEMCTVGTECVNGTLSGVALTRVVDLDIRTPTKAVCLKSAITPTVTWMAKIKALNTYCKIIETLLKTAVASPSDDKMQYWFGTNFKSTTIGNDLENWTKKLLAYWQSLRLIVFKCDPTMDDFAYTHQDPTVRSSWKKDALIDCRVTHGQTPEIGLGLGYKATTYSDGEVVCAFIHELTHLAIGTNDLLDMDGYGADSCRKLALENNENALSNAESWAYYLCSYRNGGIDWAFMTPGEVLGRRSGAQVGKF